MTIQLKIRRKALELETKLTHKYENHYRDCGRKLRGWYSKRHKKDEPKPEAPVIERTEEETLKVAGYISEHYAKLWNLTDFRKRLLQHEARHLHLLRGFLKDQPYSEIETTGTYHHPDREYLMELAQEYSEDSDNVLKDKFIVWWDEAAKHIEDHDKFRAKKREEETKAEAA